MGKATITLRIDKACYNKSKQESSRLGFTISKFLTKVGQLYINEGEGTKTNYSSHTSLQKVIIYLDGDLKKSFKKFSIENNMSLSDFFAHALHYYFNHVSEDVLKPKAKFVQLSSYILEEEKKRITINFYIDSELKRQLDHYCIDNNKTRTEVIKKAVETVSNEELNKVDYHGYMKIQSSFKAEKRFNEMLTNNARMLSINKSELINRAIYLYINS